VTSPFESVTKIAIEEIIQKNASESKFGYILSKDAFHELAEDIFQLMQMSRSLKSSGDTLLKSGSLPYRKVGQKTLR